MRAIVITIIIQLATVSVARRLIEVSNSTLTEEDEKLAIDQFIQGDVDPLVGFVLERYEGMCRIPTDFWTLFLGSIAECVIRDASQEEQMTLTLEDKQRLLRLNSTCALEDETECHHSKCWLTKTLEEVANLYKKFGEPSERIMKQCKKKGPREGNFKKVIKEKLVQGDLDPLIEFLYGTPPSFV